jgi:hypothetical protein
MTNDEKGWLDRMIDGMMGCIKGWVLLGGGGFYAMTKIYQVFTLILPLLLLTLIRTLLLNLRSGIFTSLPCFCVIMSYWGGGGGTGTILSFELRMFAA